MDIDELFVVSLKVLLFLRDPLLSSPAAGLALDVTPEYPEGLPGGGGHKRNVKFSGAVGLFSPPPSPSCDHPIFCGDRGVGPLRRSRKLNVPLRTVSLPSPVALAMSKAIYVNKMNSEICKYLQVYFRRDEGKSLAFYFVGI